MKVGANIIAMYPSNSISIAAGQLAIAILVMFSYPMQIPICRICLDKVFHASGQVQSSTLPSDAGDASVVDGREAGEMSAIKHTALTVGIVLCTFTTAYFVDNLEIGKPLARATSLRRTQRTIVLSLIGATGSTMVSFILPGLSFWKLTMDDPRTSKLLRTSALGLAVYGILVCIFR